MPVTPEEFRLIKEKFADLFINFQQGTIDLPDALAAVRDFTIPTEEVGEPTPPVPDGGDPNGVPPGPGTPDPQQSGDDGTGGDQGAPPTPDPEALASAQAELDAALEVALGHTG
jgi:hypothetical protein